MIPLRRILLVLFLALLALAAVHLLTPRRAASVRELTPPARPDCAEVWLPVAEDDTHEVFAQFYVCKKSGHA